MGKSNRLKKSQQKNKENEAALEDKSRALLEKNDPLLLLATIQAKVIANEKENCTRETQLEKVDEEFRKRAEENGEKGQDYLDLLEEAHQLKRDLVGSEYTCDFLAREKDVLKAELQKVTKSRDAVQSLANDLFQQKKALVDDLALAKQTLELRVQEAVKATSDKIMPTIEKIQGELQEQEANRQQTVAENIELREKLQKLFEMFDKSQAEFTEKLELMKEKEVYDKKREVQMLEQEAQIAKLTLMVHEKDQTEAHLKNNLQQYEAELPKMQKMISETTQHLKKDVEKSLKRIKELELENENTKKKLVSSEISLNRREKELFETNQAVLKVVKQRDTLEKLCRQLHQDLKVEREQKKQAEPASDGGHGTDTAE